MAGEKVCSGSAGTIEYVFNTIQHDWTSDTVVLYAGMGPDVEADKDPYTYYMRGLYFDGSNSISTFGTTSEHRFNFHNEFTIEIWCLPDAGNSDSSVIFSKVLSTGSGSLVKLHTSDDEHIHMELTRYTDAKAVDLEVGTYSSTAWTYFVSTISYTPENVVTAVSGYTNGLQTASDSVEDFVFMDTSDSEATLGAQFGAELTP